MEYQSDQFVSYTETTVPPNESFPDLDFMLQSPFTDTSGGHSYSQESNSYMQNHSVSHQSFGSPYASPEDPKTNRGQKRRQKTGSLENEYTMGENSDKNLTELSNNSKKIQKRNKAKARAKIKQNMAMVMAVAPEKYIPSGIDDPNLDDKTKRKMIQMAKNRMAAQKTRDRKKQYTSELEEVKNHLAEVNAELEEKNRLLEERIKALEMNQVYLLQENQELKKNQFLESFYQPYTEPVPSSYETEYNSTSEYNKSLPSPSPSLTRRPSRNNNNYFNFFLGVIAICAVYTGINIKIGQETENIPDPFKDRIEEWTLEGFEPPGVPKAEVPPSIEEAPPSIARTFAKSKKGDAEAATFSTYSTASTVKSQRYAPRTVPEGGAEEPPQIAMTMSLTTADTDEIQGYDYSGEPYDASPYAATYASPMAASLMMDNRVYQPKTPMKSKWEYISEILTLHRGWTSKWEDPKYSEPGYYEPISMEMGVVSGEYDNTYDPNEVVFLNNIDDNTEDVVNQEAVTLNVNSTGIDDAQENLKKKIGHQELDYGFAAEGHKGFDENMAVQASA